MDKRFIKNKKSPSEDRDFYFEWLKHEDNLFSNRSNFFILSESMLFAAVGFFFSENLSSIGLLIPFTGIFISSVWIFISCKHLFTTERYVKEKLKEKEHRWKEISDRIKDKYPAVHELIGIYLPIGFIIVWVIFIVIQ